MGEIQDIHIWPVETGITDLPGDLSALSLASMSELRATWQRHREQLENHAAIQTFSNELAREWAIETGQIEGLYSIERGVTQSLIEHGISAKVLERGATNRAPEFVLALLKDQQDALEGLFSFVKQERRLSVGYIKELHQALTRSQPTTEAKNEAGDLVEIPMEHGVWKRTPNYPSSPGKRFLYCPPEQTASEMDRLVAMHLEHAAREVAPETQAAWLHHRFTQIHPFQDGNGRVARALATLVLIRGQMFPYIVPTREKDAYLDALEAADSGNLRPLVLNIALGQEAQLARGVRRLQGLTPITETPIEH